MGGQGDRKVNKQLYEQFALIGKAFGSARRLELIDLLAQAEYSVEKLAQETGMSVANTSQHLQILRTARLVDVRREGVVAYYSLANPDVAQTWHAIRDLGEHCLAEVDRLAGRLYPQRSPEKWVPFDELEQLLDDDDIVILDVRPEDEYQYSHITGALSMPLGDLPAYMEELDRERPVVAYCRGPYSTLSDQAVKILLAAGFDARRLALGLPEWRAYGYPTVAVEAEYTS